MGTKLKKMLPVGARKRHTRRIQGVALLTKLAADGGVRIPRNGPERYEALRTATEESHLTVGIFRRDTGELLKPWERRTAVKAGLAPLRAQASSIAARSSFVSVVEVRPYTN